MLAHPRHPTYQPRLMDLDELEREDILASRQEEMQKYKDSLNINRLFSAAQAGGDDSVALAAKRELAFDRIRRAHHSQVRTSRLVLPQRRRASSRS